MKCDLDDLERTALTGGKDECRWRAILEEGVVLK